MINIYDFLDINNYKIIDTDSEINIHYKQNGTINQENYLKLIFEHNHQVIYYVSRGELQKIGTFTDKMLATLILVAKCYKTFERVPINNQVKTNLYTKATSNEIQAALEIIKNECHSQFYEIFSFKQHAICLIKNGDLFDVFYNGINECKDLAIKVKFSRAIIVLLNYTKLLESYYTLYDRIFVIDKDKKYYNTILKYYMFE